MTEGNISGLGSKLLMPDLNFTNGMELLTVKQVILLLD